MEWFWELCQKIFLSSLTSLFSDLISRQRNFLVRFVPKRTLNQLQILQSFKNEVEMLHKYCKNPRYDDVKVYIIPHSTSQFPKCDLLSVSFYQVLVTVSSVSKFQQFCFCQTCFSVANYITQPMNILENIVNFDLYLYFGQDLDHPKEKLK